MNAVATDIKSRISAGVLSKDICILHRENRKCYSCLKRLEERDISALVLQKNQADDPEIEGVRIATMHRVKGMEFRFVYIVGMTSSNLPPHNIVEKAENEDDRNDLMKQEANLLSVAISRAKEAVWISYCKEPSLLLENLQSTSIHHLPN